MEKRISKKNRIKTVTLCFVAIVILVVAQLLAQLIGGLISLLNLPVIGAIVTAVLYPAFAFFIVKIIVGKVYGYSLKELRIDIPRVKWYWAMASIVLPLFVIGSFKGVVSGTISCGRCRKDCIKLKVR